MGKTKPVSEFELHDVHEIIPDMSDAEWESFKKDVKENGIMKKVEVDPNNPDVILDGRHRLEVAKELGVEELEYEKADLNGNSPTEYAVKSAMLRRHLSKGQKAMLAAEVKPRFEEEAKKRQKEAGEKYGKGSRKISGSSKDKDKHKNESAHKAGELFGVSGRTVEKAEKVKEAAKENPEKYGDIAKEVNSGELSTDRAYRKIKRERGREEREKKKEELPIPPELNRGELPLDEIICGEAIETLKQFPENSIHFCMFSPGYWGLRDYGMDDQIGLEDDYNEYITNLVNLCGELKRVLRDDGSLWIVIGDTYSGSGGGSGQYKKSPNSIQYAPKVGWNPEEAPPHAKTDVPSKCKMLMPYRLALALIDDGWILRNDVTWVKQILFEDGTSYGAAMPSSVKDRLTTNTEVVFHFTQSQDYWYDLDAIRVPIKEKSKKRAEYPVAKFGGNPNAPRAKLGKGKKGGSETKIVKQNPRGKNPGDAWRISTAQSNEAHYAPYPEKLVERPLKASCPPKVCARCGSPYVRELEEVGKEEVNAIGTQGKQGDLQYNYETHRIIYEDKGWKPTCGCNTGTRPGIALDPMAGTGTTLAVAKKFGRNFVGIDLNPDYVEIAEERLEGVEND